MSGLLRGSGRTRAGAIGAGSLSVGSPDLTCLYYSYGFTNGILLCRHHHRAKRRDGWWPTLHPDGTVTWTPPDRRTRTDPPPAIIDHHITTLTHASTTAANTADHAYDAGPGYRSAPAGSDPHAGPTTAAETRGTYHTGHPPPRRPPPRRPPPRPSLAASCP
jgi:hypothetical protein